MIRRVIAHGFNLKEIYVDTVGNPITYQAKLKHFFPSIDITVSKKADSLFPIVSAASIVAKVSRDQILEGWIFVFVIVWLNSTGLDENGSIKA